MCNNAQCPIHAGEPIRFDNEDNSIEVETFCAHGDFTGTAWVFKEGWWSGLHPDNNPDTAKKLKDFT